MLIESSLIGFIGGAIGIIIGLIFNISSNQLFYSYTSRAGGENVKLFIAPPWFIILVLFGVIIVSILTGLYPAFRASRVNALEVLRHE